MARGHPSSKTQQKRLKKAQNPASQSVAWYSRWFLFGFGSVLVVFLASSSLVDLGNENGVGLSRRTRLAAYAPDYRLGDLALEKNLTFVSTVLDDIILFSVPFSATGAFYPEEIFNTPSELSHFLKGVSKDGLETVFISVGGAGRSAEFHQFLENFPAQEQFFQNVKRFISQHEQVKLEWGVDFDPEIQFTEHTTVKFNTFLTRLKSNLEKHTSTGKVQISVALHHWQDLGKSTYEIIDRVNLMAYDLTKGQHSSLQHSKSIALKFLRAGVPSEKLYLGLPCYGRHETNPGEVKTFQELVSSVDDHDLKLKIANDHIYKGFHYNGIQMVRQKAQVIKELSLGGMFFWEAGQDLLIKNLSLLEAASHSLRT